MRYFLLIPVLIGMVLLVGPGSFVWKILGAFMLLMSFARLLSDA